MTNSFPQTARRLNRENSGALAALMALAALVLVTATWAVSMRSDRDDALTRVTGLQAEIDQIRAQSNATAYHLTPTSEAPQNANGTAFFSLSGTGMIAVSNLEPAPQGRSYQVWYYPTSDAAPLPGAKFKVDGDGSGFMLIPADAGLFTGISVTLEPEAGVTSPSGPVILTGTTGGARG